MQRLIYAILRHTRRIIVLGEGLRAQFFGFLPGDRIIAIPNGIPDLFAFADKGQEVGGETNVLFLSNLTREKGVFVVLEAARIVIDHEPSVRFTLAGTWFRDSDRLAAEKLVKELGLADHVYFPGIITGDEKRRTLANSQLLVFPPVAPEGFGLVILEAMSAGLPVVVARQGAIPDVVVQGVTGFIVEPDDSDAVAERILLLLQDGSLRQRMGQSGRERFLSHYTLAHCTGRLATVFRDVLDEVDR